MAEHKADRKIDYDEGVLIMNHPTTGMDVFMYISRPGKYLDAHANSVPDQLAKEAGYDTEKLSKDKLRIERKAQASDIIDKELADEASTKEEVVSERNDFKLVTIGMGRFNVKDPDGNILNKFPLSEESATKLFDVMAGSVLKSSSIKLQGKAKVMSDRKNYDDYNEDEVAEAAEKAAKDKVEAEKKAADEANAVEAAEAAKAKVEAEAKAKAKVDANKNVK